MVTLEALVRQQWQQGMLAGLGAAVEGFGRWLVPPMHASAVGSGTGVGGLGRWLVPPASASAVGSGAGAEDCGDGDDAIDHWRSMGVYLADVDVLGRGLQALLRPARPALTPADLGIDMAGGMAGVDHAGYDDQWGEEPPDWEADGADDAGWQAEARSAEAELRREEAEARVGRTSAEQSAYLAEALGHVPDAVGPSGLERRRLAAEAAKLAAASGASAADAEVRRVQARWLQRAVERAASAARATGQPVAWVACRYGQECRRRGCWWQHPRGRRYDWEAVERQHEELAQAEADLLAGLPSPPGVASADGAAPEEGALLARLAALQQPVAGGPIVPAAVAMAVPTTAAAAGAAGPASARTRKRRRQRAAAVAAQESSPDGERLAKRSARRRAKGGRVPASASAV